MMPKVTRAQLAEGRHQHADYSWWEYDAQGIELAKVCEDCIDAALAGYRPEILRGYDQSDVDEPIEPEDEQAAIGSDMENQNYYGREG
jgi:hypothetical protein